MTVISELKFLLLQTSLHADKAKSFTPTAVRNHLGIHNITKPGKESHQLDFFESEGRIGGLRPDGAVPGHLFDISDHDVSRVGRIGESISEREELATAEVLPEPNVPDGHGADDCGDLSAAITDELDVSDAVVRYGMQRDKRGQP